MAIKDPTKDEMVAFLETIDASADAFDIEEAIYWFAHHYHGGQSSNLYSVLSTSDYHPGPLCRGPEDTFLYRELEDEYGA